MWIKSLTTKLTKSQYSRMLEYFHFFNNAGDTKSMKFVKSVIQVVTEANIDKITDWKECHSMMFDSLKKIMQPEIDEMCADAYRNGQNKFAALISRLSQDNRGYDIDKVCSDTNYRELLYNEYHID